MRSCSRIVVLCLVLLAGLAVPAYAIAADEPLMHPTENTFYDRSGFLLTSLDSGYVTDIRNWHALSGYEYSSCPVFGSGLACDPDQYVVIAFSSQGDATQYNSTPVAYPKPDYPRPLPLSARLTPEEQAHVLIDPKNNSCLVDYSFVFRNLYFEFEMWTTCHAGMPPARVTSQAETTLAWLLARARSLVTNVTGGPSTATHTVSKPWIPPISAFARSDMLQYTPPLTYQQDQTTLCNGNLADHGVVAWYLFSSVENSGIETPEYMDISDSSDSISSEVLVFDSAQDANAYNNSAPGGPFIVVDTSQYVGASVTYNGSPWMQVAVPNRLTSNERAFTAHHDSDVGGTRQDFVLRLAYGNLVLLTLQDKTDDTYHNPITGDGLTFDTMLEFLLNKARAISPYTTASARTAQRNSAFVALVRTLKRTTAPCVNLTNDMYKNFLTLDADILAGRSNPLIGVGFISFDIGSVDSECADAAQLLAPDSGLIPFPIDPRITSSIAIQKLVHVYEEAAMSTRLRLLDDIKYYAIALQGNDGAVANSDFNTVIADLPRVQAADNRVQQQVAYIAHAWGVNGPS